jgi:hypothetical protein
MTGVLEYRFVVDKKIVASGGVTVNDLTEINKTVLLRKAAELVVEYIVEALDKKAVP